MGVHWGQHLGIRRRTPGHLSPDGVSYLYLAKLVRLGQFHEAVNAIWPPVYPLVSALVQALGVPATVSLTVAQGLGAGVVYSQLVVANRGVGVGLRFALALMGGGLALLYGLLYTTPDVWGLVAALGLVQGGLAVAMGTPTRGTYLRLGGWVLLGFFCRHYLVVWGLAWLVWVGVYCWGRTRALPKGLAISALVVALGCGAWVGATYTKYGVPYLTGQGAYGAYLRSDARGYPVDVHDWAGPLPLPTPLATSADDDRFRPGVLAGVPPQADRRFGRVGRWQSIALNTQLFKGFLVFWGPWLLAVVLAAWAYPARWLLAVGLGGYALGFVLTHIEDRFLLPLLVVPLLAAGATLATSARRWQRGLVAALLVAALYGGWRTYRDARHHLTHLPPVAQLSGGRWVSDSRWSETAVLAYRTGAQYLGRLQENTPSGIAAAARTTGATHVQLWQTPPDSVQRYLPDAQALDLPEGYPSVLVVPTAGR